MYKNPGDKKKYSKEYYEKNKNSIKEYQKEYNKSHTKDKEDYNKNYKEEHYEDLKKYLKEYNKTKRPNKKEYNKEYREKNKEILAIKQKALNKKYQDKTIQKNKVIKRELKREVYKIISEKHNHPIKCWRCEENREWVLSIGHINEDGFKDRKKYGTGGIVFFRAIISGERPVDDLEIECIKCNLCKEWNGKYPDEITIETYENLPVRKKSRVGYPVNV